LKKFWINGKMPLPPYITAELENKERYQTVYAKESGFCCRTNSRTSFYGCLTVAHQAKGVEVWKYYSMSVWDFSAG
jgi:S-adenosylmethionine:tRNA ribosyltransferase-isomerase